MIRFNTTRWSIVRDAGLEAPDARVAMETLCRLYRPPVYAHVRSRGYSHEAAEDLVQAFFVHFLDKALNAGAEPERGRFRGYLITALKHFVFNREEAARTAKRGGGIAHGSLDDAAELDLAVRDDGPDDAFDRTWAFAVLGRATARLGDEADSAGKRALFDSMRPFLFEAPDPADYADTASSLGMKRNTFAVAVHRMRHRFRELVVAELADTTSAQNELDAELVDLRDALGMRTE